jgi:hypothetical protein
MLRRYGLWLLTCPRSLDDPKIRHEGKNGYENLTQFQHAIGIRYSKGRAPRFPNSKGGFVGFSRSAPRNVNLLLKGFFANGPMSSNKLVLCSGHRALLSRATGFAILWAPHLRFVSVNVGAHLVGKVLVHEQNES